MSVYLKLFNGRKAVGENLDDRGTEGPTLGPLRYVYGTYQNHLAVQNYTKHNAVEGWIEYVNDCLYYDGSYYGDFSVTSAAVTAQFGAVLFDPTKAELLEGDENPERQCCHAP